MEERLAFNTITRDLLGYHLKKQIQSVLLGKGGHQPGQLMGLEPRQSALASLSYIHLLSPFPYSVSHGDVVPIPEKQERS